jgi:hypothetical protein
MFLTYPRAVVRRPSLLAPGVAQATILVLIVTARPYAAAVTGLLSVAWLALLIAMADDRTTRARAERDTTTSRIADLEAELAEANTDPVTGLPARRRTVVGPGPDLELSGLGAVVGSDTDVPVDIGNARGCVAVDHVFGV